MACDANLTRLVLGPDGQPLDYGRSQRLVPPALRTVVVQRDKHCVFAGCQAPSHWCDVHHLLEWIFGGETSLENSGLLCERHHTQVHHGFRIERDTTGRWHTHRPDGTEKKSFSSLSALSGESEPWTRLSGRLKARSPRMVPGSASAGLVAPMSLRMTLIAPSPSTLIATTGVVVMNSTSSPKKGFSRCSA